MFRLVSSYINQRCNCSSVCKTLQSFKTYKRSTDYLSLRHNSSFLDIVPLCFPSGKFQPLNFSRLTLTVWVVWRCKMTCEKCQSWHVNCALSSMLFIRSAWRSLWYAVWTFHSFLWCCHIHSVSWSTRCLQTLYCCWQAWLPWMRELSQWPTTQPHFLLLHQQQLMIESNWVSAQHKVPEGNRD